MGKPLISVLIHTASHDDFLSPSGVESYFESVVLNLAHQTFNEIELVYVDSSYKENQGKFQDIASNASFQIKHVPIHNSHKYWFDRGKYYISAAKNTGIIYADGELCVTFDDAEFFPSGLLEKYWRNYRDKNTLLLALHKRVSSVSNHGGRAMFPIKAVEKRLDVDPRWKLLKNKKYSPSGDLAFAGTCFPLEAAVSINGFNEKMDGQKSLEDCEFGMRLEKMGYRFAFDKNAFVFILDHAPYSRRKPIGGHEAIENFSFIEMIKKGKCDLVANKLNLSEEQMVIVREQTKKFKGFYPDAIPENLSVWEKTPFFDLRSEREALRKSPGWQWNMKIQDFIKTELPKIHGWCSQVKAKKMATILGEIKPKLCVEIGVFGGSSLITQALALKENCIGEIIRIDQWEKEAAIEDVENQVNKKWWGEINLEEIYEHCLAKIEEFNVGNFVKIMRMKSLDAAVFFENESIDTIHIDGNHTEKQSYQDAVTYFPKIKIGGHIFFDDIDWIEAETNSTKKALDYLSERCDLIEVIENMAILRKKMAD